MELTLANRHHQFDINAVYNQLDHSNLTSLDLSSNQLTNKEGIDLSQHLLTNTSLKSLNLSDNKSLNGKTASALATALKVNQSLTTLSLARSSFGNHSAQALAEALQTNTTLTDLDLEENRIGREGGLALITALAYNTTLCSLKIDNQKRDLFWDLPEQIKQKIRAGIQRNQGQPGVTTSPSQLDSQLEQALMILIQSPLFGHESRKACLFLIAAIPACFRRHFAHDSSLSFHFPFALVKQIFDKMGQFLGTENEEDKLLVLRLLHVYLDYGIIRLQSSYQPRTFFQQYIHDFKNKLSLLGSLPKDSPLIKYEIDAIKEALNVLPSDENLFIELIRLLPSILTREWSAILAMLERLYHKVSHHWYISTLLIRQWSFCVIGGACPCLDMMRNLTYKAPEEHVSVAYIEALADIIKRGETDRIKQSAYGALSQYLDKIGLLTYQDASSSKAFSTPIIHTIIAERMAELQWVPEIGLTIRSQMETMMTHLPKGHLCSQKLYEYSRNTPHSQEWTTYLSPPGSILSAVTEGESRETVHRLFQEGAGLIHRDAMGRTALFHAVMRRDLELVLELLRLGAFPDVQDNERTTPLMVAAELDDARFMTALVKEGASLDLIDENGLSALLRAIDKKQSEIALRLIQKGARHDIMTKDGETAITLAAHHQDAAVLKKLDQFLENKDGQGKTPLMRMAMKGDDKAIKILLDHGAHSDTLDQHGRSALFYAVESQQIESAKLLLDNGHANINLQDSEGNTPLMIATRQGFNEVAVFLVNRKASTSLKNREGKRAQDYTSGQPKRVKTLYPPSPTS